MDIKWRWIHHYRSHEGIVAGRVLGEIELGAEDLVGTSDIDGESGQREARGLEDCNDSCKVYGVVQQAESFSRPHLNKGHNRKQTFVKFFVEVDWYCTSEHMEDYDMA